MIRVWLVLLGWAAAWSLILVPGGMYSWHYFTTAATVIHPATAGGGGLHVYAAHPELQMGPLALVAAAAIVSLSGSASAVMAALVMTVMGLFAMWLVVAAAGRMRGSPPSPRSTLLVGLPLIPVWATLSVHYGHLDDALAISLGVAGLVALVRNRPWIATLLLASAGAAKPWALPFALLLLAHPVDRIRRGATFIALSALAWMPFLLADPRTLTRLGAFAIVNAPDSALRALGVHTATTPPGDRAAQLGGAVLLGLWCLRSGRVAAIPAIALAFRLLLDPGTYPYYTASLLLAVICVDLLQRPRRLIPWLSIGVGLWFVYSVTMAALLPAPVVGISRAVFLIALILSLAFGRRTGPPSLGEPTVPPWPLPRRVLSGSERTGVRRDRRTADRPVNRPRRLAQPCSSSSSSRRRR